MCWVHTAHLACRHVQSKQPPCARSGNHENLGKFKNGLCESEAESRNIRSAGKIAKHNEREHQDYYYLHLCFSRYTELSRTTNAGTVAGTVASVIWRHTNEKRQQYYRDTETQPHPTEPMQTGIWARGIGDLARELEGRLRVDEARTALKWIDRGDGKLEFPDSWDPPSSSAYNAPPQQQGQGYVAGYQQPNPAPRQEERERKVHPRTSTSGESSAESSSRKPRHHGSSKKPRRQ